MEKGILVGCDKTQEWLLPWWWEHYSSHNQLPVAFFDFGMSNEGRAWCEKRGEVRAFSLVSLKMSQKALEHREDWEKRCGEDVWALRSIWLQKPRVCCESPFSLGIWLDLDCEVRGPLHPLFDALGNADIAVAKDLSSKDVYNSGVIVFKKNAKILQEWLDKMISLPDDFLGDQDYLSLVLQQSKFIELPSIYNWSCMDAPNKGAVIVHFLGARGKVEILQKIAATQFLEALK